MWKVTWSKKERVKSGLTSSEVNSPNARDFFRIPTFVFTTQGVGLSEWYPRDSKYLVLSLRQVVDFLLLLPTVPGRVFCLQESHLFSFSLCFDLFNFWVLSSVDGTYFSFCRDFIKCKRKKGYRMGGPPFLIKKKTN